MKFNEEVNKILNEGSKEYVIWGVPPDGHSEQLLMTKYNGKTITDSKTAKKLADILTKKYDAKKVRVQEIDMTNFDWNKEIGM